MKFFIDTANLDEIKEAKELGMIDGVTTNPSLVAKEGCQNREDFKKLIHEICEVVQGPVSAEVVSIDADGMVKEARELAKIHEHVVVKVPMITDGLKATLQLTSESIKTNVTLVFFPSAGPASSQGGRHVCEPFRWPVG